jgi:Calcium-binding EGF domain
LSVSRYNSHRRLPGIFRKILCAPIRGYNKTKWETVNALKAVAGVLRSQGAVNGDCGKNCRTLCKHKSCHDDYMEGTNGYTCTCVANTVPRCGVNTKCVDEQCRCKFGYAFDSKGICQDENECSTGNICSSNGACVNTNGGYDCVCNSGYTFNGQPGTGCVDLDECEYNPPICGPNSICTNTVGNYTCACANGYGGTPPACTDVDECTTIPAEQTCGFKGTCVNTIGSYNCTCDVGYARRDQRSICTDINECLANTSPCGSKEICTNTGECVIVVAMTKCFVILHNFVTS